MKILRLLAAAVLSLPAAAEVAEQSFTINYGGVGGTDLLRLIASASRANDPEITTYKRMLKEWRNQKSAEDEYETVCETSAYLNAEVYPLDPANLHPQIAWAASELEEMFTGQPYPGDYDQAEHPDGYRVVRMDYDQLPTTIKQWMLDNPEQKSICEVDGVAFFAPGVILQMLGLFAGEGEGDCRGQFPTDPEAFFGEKEGDVFFGANYLARSEVGNSLKIKAYAQKRARKTPIAQATERDEL